MSNIRGLSDLKGEDEDDNRKHNDYYAGGEKRWVGLLCTPAAQPTQIQ